MLSDSSTHIGTGASPTLRLCNNRRSSLHFFFIFFFYIIHDASTWKFIIFERLDKHSISEREATDLFLFIYLMGTFLLSDRKKIFASSGIVKNFASYTNMHNTQRAVQIGSKLGRISMVRKTENYCFGIKKKTAINCPFLY